MARGRKTTKVKIVTYNDSMLLKQLANTGLCSMEQAKSHCGLNRDRLLKLEKSGYIKIEKSAPVGGKMMEFARLDIKGRGYCENKFGTQYFYKSNLNQCTHDMKLTEAYYQVFMEHPGAVWKNETQVTYENKDTLLNGKDCVDAVVEIGDGCFAVEVIGHKYTQETIDNKIANGNRIAGKIILI
ncbi:hypothetical protein JW813_17555 (plasmid) [Clostridium botulinum]|uniref:hypothetical protein n=1 Tax=Clostridium botulinum TaxID=1491 RepID=UPI002248145D|nr:hypothetical protein [Clostridium botulinum]UZP05179.1 hypothetical protein JW813_17555 [Clostridium botulinum]UZP08567.1 hypothetical protein JYA71_17820 [Clostridium botulinum]UZP11920.1 hypothetical protein JYA74_17640 [Clostridium botulinum]